MEREISYMLKRSKRAKRFTMSLRGDGLAVLTAPMRASKAAIEAFAKESAPWLSRKLSKFEKYFSFPEGTGTEAHYERHKEDAREAITERVRHWNHAYGFEIAGISIRNQSTRWGSCSREKTLSFNYRLHFLPQELSDYVIVHEICHAKEMNHSARFWDLVARTVPEYRARRAELRQWRL